MVKRGREKETNERKKDTFKKLAKEGENTTAGKREMVCVRERGREIE